MNSKWSRLSLSREERITRIISMKNLKFCDSSAKKKGEKTKSDYNFDFQRSLKVYVRLFSVLLYLKAIQKIIKNIFISSQTILYLPYFP